MEDRELRMLCIERAIEAGARNDAVMEKAHRFYEWVTGQKDGNLLRASKEAAREEIIAWADLASQPMTGEQAKS